MNNKEYFPQTTEQPEEVIERMKNIKAEIKNLNDELDVLKYRDWGTQDGLQIEELQRVGDEILEYYERNYQLFTSDANFEIPIDAYISSGSIDILSDLLRQIRATQGWVEKLIELNTEKQLPVKLFPEPEQLPVSRTKLDEMVKTTSECVKNLSEKMKAHFKNTPSLTSMNYLTALDRLDSDVG